MSHHYSGPDFGFPNRDARLNLTDLYAFPSPGGVGKSIIVLNVHPSSTLIPRGSTTRDPFFFDPLVALDDLRFTGKDFFTDKDVCSMVLEVPNSALGTGRLGAWGRVLQQEGHGWVQVDRVGRPSQGIFLVGEQRPAYIAAEPADDARFIPTFAHSLQHSRDYNEADARRVASTLLPDILGPPHHP